MKNTLTRCNNLTGSQNQEFSLTSDSAEQTKQIGHALVTYLGKSVNIGLFGELGAGKTQLVKGMARGLHIDEDEVVSPSFGLINVYEGDKKLYHVDLYRLESTMDIETIGLDEVIFGKGLCVIEWADRLKRDAFFLDIRIHITIHGHERRVLRFSGGISNNIHEALKPFNPNKEIVWR